MTPCLRQDRVAKGKVASEGSNYLRDSGGAGGRAAVRLEGEGTEGLDLK
jgi:hypothetical protein